MAEKMEIPIAGGDASDEGRREILAAAGKLEAIREQIIEAGGKEKMSDEQTKTWNAALKEFIPFVRDPSSEGESEPWFLLPDGYTTASESDAAHEWLKKVNTQK